jgi:hypothetical protein
MSNRMLRTVLLAVAGLCPIQAADTAEQLAEIGRVATAMVDGDLCERILTRRAIAYFLKVDPRDRWAAADNFDVNDEAYIPVKKTLIRLGRLGPPHTDVNLWMPVPGDPSRVQILIRNANEISQFWTWGELHQPAVAEMTRVLATGRPETVTRRPGFVSVLAPVRNSLDDIVGFVEVVTQFQHDPHGNVK